jgi:hypothetical protein
LSDFDHVDEIRRLVPAPGVGSGWKPDIRTRFLRAVSDYHIDDGACFLQHAASGTICFGAAGEE